MTDQVHEQMTFQEIFAYLDMHPDKRVDFIDGEMVEVSPKPMHGFIQAKLASIFDRWLEDRNIGYVHTEVLHILDGENLMPDVSINRDLAKGQSYFDTPPLLVVEIRSDTQSRAAQRRKALKYIAHGTPAVLIVMPDEHIELFTSTEDKPRIFHSGETVEGMPGLEGLQVEISRLW